MSSAPRPQTQPSTSSPPHGSRLHSSGSARTVSTWREQASASARRPPAAAARSGWRAPARPPAARTRSPRPSAAPRAAPAARARSPGGLTVSTRISRCSCSTASAPRPGGETVAAVPSDHGRRLVRADGSYLTAMERRDLVRAVRASRAARRPVRRTGVPAGDAAAGDADAPARPRRVRRPGRSARAGLGAARRDRVRRAPQRGLLRAARDRQDDAGADHRRHGADGAFEELSAVNAGPRRGARGDRARRGAARRRAGRRSSSSTRSTASTRPSRTRCCRRSRRACVTLIGATTENPYFEVNSALLSRAQIYEFRPLDRGGRRGAAAPRARATSAASPDPPAVADEALEMLAARAGGDARVALAALERAVETTARPAAAARSASRPSRTRCSARPCSTTARATATTTTSRPGSRRPAAPTWTPPSTTWR